MDIKRVQKRLLSMAQEIHSILDESGIDYVITYGTLLGAVRNMGFIPWDDDFDIYLFDDSYDEAVELLRNNLPDDLFLEDAVSEPLYFHGWAHVKDLFSIAKCDLYVQDGVYKHQGLSVDLYKATKIDESQLESFQLIEKKEYLKRKFERHLIDADSYWTTLKTIDDGLKALDISIRSGRNIYAFMSLDGDYLTPDEVYPRRKYSFESIDFWGPNQYDSFLKRCYGNYMELPPEDKRKPHYADVQFL